MRVHVVVIHKSDTPRRLLNSKIWHLIDKLAQAISSCLGQHLETFNSFGIFYSQLIWLERSALASKPAGRGFDSYIRRQA